VLKLKSATGVAHEDRRYRSRHSDPVSVVLQVCSFAPKVAPESPGERRDDPEDADARES